VIGEGGSGGALALGVADRVLMLENSVYSVISPEGCAAILWKTPNARDQAAEALKLTATDLAGLSVIDDIVPEPMGGAQTDWDATAGALRVALLRHLTELEALSADERREQRWRKFEAMGEWVEA
jgi:acetyl-CoA carboxylase carboxyl transferase subunit alpha